MPGPNFMLMQTNLWVEAIYALIIIVSCLIIYLKTRELYALTSHRGIKYFMNVFLFFGIGYFFSFFISTPHLWRGIQSAGTIAPIFLFITIYASTMAVLYLVYSVHWKKSEQFTNKIYLLHVTALAVAGITLLIQRPILFVTIQLILFIYAAVMSYLSHRKSKTRKGFSSMYIIYILLFAFWILKMFGTALPPFFVQMKVFVYAISVILFLLILFGVLKKTK